MIPKGVIFSGLRERMFDFYPRKCRIDLKNKISFRDWLEVGTYIPISVSKSEIVLEASHEDLSSIFLLETELLFNNCTEHLVELNRLILDTLPRSDAWNLVTFYYFGFFAAHAFLRMIGTPLVYLQAGILNRVSEMLGTTTKIGGGSFYIEKTRELSLTSSEYRLKKMRGRFHEATWFKSINLIEEVVEHTKNSAKPDESLFFSNLTNKTLFKIYEEYGWPSSIRNKANYRLGYAYRLIDNKTIAGIKKILRNMIADPSDFPHKIDTSISQCVRSSEDRYFSTHVNTFFYTLMGFYYVFKELYVQLIERKDIDQRLHYKRQAFLKKTGGLLNNYQFS
jgi:hypothetical protein